MKPAADEHHREEASEEEASEIEPGMTVETTAGDLGEHDVSKPRVKRVVRDAQGDVQNVIVEKGVIFRKQIDVAADRIESVQPPAAGEPGEVTVATTKDEVNALGARGPEALPPEDDNGVLEQVQENLPTASGLRTLEAEKALQPSDEAASHEQTTDEHAQEKPHFSLRSLGPGFLSGMAGNDASAVTSYAIDGATAGYSQLWLLVLATPLYQAVQYACAKLGRVTQQGLASVLREHYGRKVAFPAALLLIVANTGLITANLVAISTGIELLTGLAWEWFVVPVAAILWYVTVYENFGVIKKVFIVMSLAFVAYLVTGIISGPDWGAVLRNTFVPQITLSFAGISTAVALLGATVSPYTMFWQVEGEREQRRPGTRKQQLRLAAADIAAGTLSGNLVAFFIIVSTSATLFAHHQHIATAADAALALQPLVGPFAKEFFAIGLIGAGLVAIPVLLASTSYAVSGSFGWPASLWKKPWQAEGFYLILTGSLVISLILALLRFDPIQLLFWVNVLQGVLSPALVIILALAANNRAIMGKARIGRLTTLGLIATATVMSAAALLLIVGLLTGAS
ncbi:MAG: NRAMP family divalent metal transporter [Ktedonobacterales bacterium]